MISVKNFGQEWREKERTESGEEKSFKEVFFLSSPPFLPSLSRNLSLGGEISPAEERSFFQCCQGEDRRGQMQG